MNRRRVRKGNVFRGLVAGAFAVGAYALLAQGCSGVAFGPARDRAANGIRYYRPATYILVKPDYEKREAEVTVLHAPDTSIPYAADPYSVLSSNHTILEFERGMLSSVSSESDSTKLAATTIQAAAAVGKEALQAAGKAAELAAAAARKGPAPELQRTAEPPVYLFLATGDGVRQVYP